LDKVAGFGCELSFWRETKILLVLDGRALLLIKLEKNIAGEQVGFGEIRFQL
jgi:hypothetical protein